MENAIVKILSRIDINTLPVVPKVLLDLMDVIAREDVSIDNLAKIIGQDASLSASILAAANSSFYRQWGEVTDLKRMMVVMGLTSVKTLVMTRTIQQFFAGIPSAQQHYVEIIWYRSLTCAHLARNLAQLMAYEFPDEAYLAGLIHRLGQLILMQCYPKEYADFLAEHLDRGDQAEAEKTMFGATYNEIGAHVIGSWALQSFIADAVLYQHQVVENIADSAALVKIVNLASQLTCMNEGNKYFVFGQAHKLFGLNQALLESMLEDVKPLVGKSAGSLGISIAHADNNDISNETTAAQRESMQELLGDRVKNFALAAAIQEPLKAAGDCKKLIATLRRDMSVLFGFPAVAVFLYRPETESLEGISNEQGTDSLWSTLSISLNTPSSLLAKAWHKKQMLHSFNINKTDPVMLIDRQICQLLHTDDMLLIPIIHGARVLGVIAVGLKRADVKRIKLNQDFMRLFIGEAAKILHNLQASTHESVQNMTEIRTSFELFARKLGHEINNPLSIINNYLYLLGLKLGNDQMDEIKVIQEEINRVGTITLSLSDFSIDALKPANDLVDVNVLIIDLIALFDAGLFKTHNISTRLSFDNPTLKLSTHKDKLKQIVTNLIKNAVEALPEGGGMIISTKENVTWGKNNYAEIRIQDNGSGIPAEIMAHLFKPVKSTKGKGYAGLGLTIAKNLVDELKGIIRCDSSAENGTTFYIYLPKDI